MAKSRPKCKPARFDFFVPPARDKTGGPFYPGFTYANR